MSPDNLFLEVLQVELKKTLLQIADITHGRISRPETFSDFLAYCALNLSVHTDPVHAKDRLAGLKQLKNNYKDNEWQGFYQGLAALCEAAAHNTNKGQFSDFFAWPYTEIGARNKALKQDFTPDGLARLMAAITLSQDTVLPEEGFFTMSDHACGSGTLLLAAADHFASLGFNPSKHLVVQAVDMDVRCVHMTYLNLAFHGIPAVVIRGDTLTLEEHDRWYTPAYLWGKWIWRAPMPFGKGGHVSDEMLKRIDEPMYGVLRQLEPLLSTVGANSIADASKNTLKNEVQS